MLVDLKSILKATAASYGASFHEVPMQISDVHQIGSASWNNPDTLRAIQSISKHMEDNVLVGLEDTSGLCYAAFRLKDQFSTFCICGPWTMHSPHAVMDPTLPEDPERYEYNDQHESEKTSSCSPDAEICSCAPDCHCQESAEDADTKNDPLESYFHLHPAFDQTKEVHHPTSECYLQMLARMLGVQDPDHPVEIRIIACDWAEPVIHHSAEKKPKEIRLKKELNEYFRLENDLVRAVSLGDAKSAQLIVEQNRSFLLLGSVQTLSKTLLRELNRLNTLFSFVCANSIVQEEAVFHTLLSYEKRIQEAGNSLNDAIECLMMMIRDYCSLVRNWSLKDYSPVVQQVISLISMNLNSPLTINSIAKQCHVSSCYLSTLFKKETGQTLSGFITSKKVELACFKLRFENESVATIAKQIGFSDISYFSRFFKKATGMTPSAYREEYLSSPRKKAAKAV